jgi:hypothetical protein
MKAEDQQQLFGEIKTILAGDHSATFAIIGRTPVAYDLFGLFRAIGAESRLLGIYYVGTNPNHETRDKPISQLQKDSPSVVIIASDELKEDLLEQALPHLSPSTKVILAGYGHFAFRNPIFDKVTRNPLVPSLANGYPNTLIHLFQCLQNAARLALEGVVVEFGMFKGGTTMLLAQFTKELGQHWRVIGFDTFAGFPPRRSALDMYSHPDCVFPDEQGVRSYVERHGIEVVSGDIVRTVKRLAAEQVVLAFIDTDNFTSASAVLDVIQDRVVLGGAIVFDHFTGRNRFLYTLGERFAAKRLLEDSRYFNLHDTGVFIKQR